MHGKTSRITHRRARRVRAACRDEFIATRYHSLVVERDSCRRASRSPRSPRTARSWACATADAAGRRRAVPPRVDAHRARPRAAAELSSTRRRHEADHASPTRSSAPSSTARSSTTRCCTLMRQIMRGELSPAQIAGVHHRPAREEGDHRRDRRRRAGDARVRDAGRGGRPHRTWSTSAAPAATRRTPSTSRPAATFVAAAAGASVAKHGGRSVSSHLGQRRRAGGARRATSTLTPEQVAECDRRVGIGFMFAPTHHAAMKHAAPVRKELGVRTIFNILGPLTNPAGAQNQVMGVFHPDLVGIQVRVLQRLGSKHVMVVYGARRPRRDLAVGRDAGRRAQERRDQRVHAASRATSACRALRPPRDRGADGEESKAMHPGACSATSRAGARHRAR